jgi:hypothetical protein
MRATLGWLGTVCLFAVLSASCGDSPNQPSTGNADCTNYQGQGTVAAIALSPFADKEAEVLAIEASGKIVAPKHVYEHIVSDLALIRSQNPSVQDITAMVSWVPNELLMGFDAEGMSTVQAGTYTDWDCANTYYGFLGKEVHPSFIQLHFDHLFNAPVLANEYSLLPHVDYAERNGIIGDGNDVCVSIENDTKYNYIFDAGFGDCPLAASAINTGASLSTAIPWYSPRSARMSKARATRPPGSPRSPNAPNGCDSLRLSPVSFRHSSRRSEKSPQKSPPKLTFRSAASYGLSGV